MQGMGGNARRRALAMLLLAGLFLQGCGSNEGQDVFYLARTINLVTDSPGQAIDIGELSFQAAYGTGTSFSSDFAGTGNIEVRAFVPGPTPTDNFEDTLILRPAESVDFTDRTAYTLINYGTVADFRSILIVDPIPDTIAPGTMEIRIAHAALGAGSVDVYVTDPDADLAASTPEASLAAGEVSPTSSRPTADYRVRITAPGSSTVIYDSGTIAPFNGGEQFLVIGRTVGPTPVPVFVSLWTRQGNPTAFTDANTPAFLRFLHLSSGSANLDLYAEDDYANPVATNVAFGGLSNYGSVADTLADGVSVLENTPVDFVATALDSEDGDVTANLAWNSSIDGALTETGGEINATLTQGTHSVVASVTDSGGLTGSAAVRVNVVSAGSSAPVVEILDPPNGFQVASGTAVTFTGQAEDDTDGDVTDTLSWSSNIDGALTGTGGSITATLSPGIHAITATATDTETLIGGESVIVDVTTTGNTAPAVTISAPDFLDAIELDLVETGTSNVPIFQGAFEIFPGAVYTQYLTDVGGVPGSAVIADPVQRVATHSLIRFINSSDLAGTVDIYATEAGTGIDGVTEYFNNLRVGLDTGVAPLAAGTWDLTFTTAGTADVLLVIPSITVSELQSNIIVLLDDDPGMQVTFTRIID